MSDYELNIKIRNGRLLERMREAGYETAAQLSRASGVSPTVIGKMLGLKITAYQPDGVTIRKPVAEVMNHLLIEYADDIFPEDCLYLELDKTEFTARVSSDQWLALENRNIEPSVLLEYSDAEENGSIDGMTKGLPGKERDIIKMRFELGMTLAEVGLRCGVSATTISRLEEKALRRMSPPSKAKQLLKHCGNPMIIIPKLPDKTRTYTEKLANGVELVKMLYK